VDTAFHEAPLSDQGVSPREEPSCTPCLFPTTEGGGSASGAAAPGGESESGAAVPSDDSLAAKLLKAPHQPTQREIDEHEVNHIPFRAWCSACVRGRAKSDAHHLIGDSEKQEATIPVISVDYGFMGESGSLAEREVGSNSLPILIVKDRASKAIWSVPVPEKGATHPYPTKMLLAILNSTGYRRIVLKSDQEPAILKLCEVVKTGWPGEVVPESSPKYVSQSNGEVERAVQEVQGLSTTLRESLQQKLKCTIDGTCCILAWLVLYASVLYRLFHRGFPHDGKTPFQRLRGREWRAPLPIFGEAVEYRRKTPNKFDARWELGIYLGLRETSGEKIVGAGDRTFVVQSIRRKPPAEAWQEDLVKGIIGTPWCPNPTRSDPTVLPAPVVLRIRNPEVPSVPTEGRRPETQPRQYYIKQSDLDAYGFTGGCPACDAIRANLPRAGKNHSIACRQRIESHIIADRMNVDQGPEGSSAQEAPAAAAAAPAASSAPVASSAAAAAPSSSAPVSSAAAAATTGKRTSAEAQLDPHPDPRTHFKDVDERVMQSLVCLDETEEDAQIISCLLSLRSEFIASVEASGQEMPEAMEPDVVAMLAEDHYCSLAEVGSEGPFYDNISGKLLDTAKVLEARRQEVEFIESMGVWVAVPRDNHKVIKARWVDVDKGGPGQENYRSRYVAKEIKRASQLTGEELGYEHFAAMPPLAALRFLITLCVTSAWRSIDGATIYRKPSQSCLSFVDVKRAHFVSPAQREIYVELPAEMGLGPDKVGKLVKSMYGCRDAGKNWELEVNRAMKSFGFIPGVSNPCLFYHPQRELRTMVHGDDFVTEGQIDELHWLNEQFASVWKVELRGIFGPPRIKGTVQAIVVLNRLLTWTTKGIEFEPDPRHVDIICRDVGTTGAKVTVPLAKESAGDDVEDKMVDSSETITSYRSNTMRGGYLAQDRPDICIAVRYLAKGMKDVTERHIQALKRFSRFLRYRPRLVQVFAPQEMIETVDAWTDSDHAGCIRTRKSTTGVVCMVGTCCIRAFTKGQGVIALSSGEAEYYGLTSGMSNGIGDCSMAKDLGVKLEPKCYLDATAGIAIGSRRGLGKVKHIDTVFLWVQDKVNSGAVKLGKKHTKEMLADMLTKQLSANEFEGLLAQMGFFYRDGRHHLALSV